MRARRLLLPIAFLALAGCDRITGKVDQKALDAEAIGYSCRISLRPPEDCIKENDTHSPTSILFGWKEADRDIREKAIDPTMGRPAPQPQQSAPPAPESKPAAAAESKPAAAAESKPVAEKASENTAAAKGEKPAAVNEKPATARNGKPAAATGEKPAAATAKPDKDTAEKPAGL